MESPRRRCHPMVCGLPVRSHPRDSSASPMPVAAPYVRQDVTLVPGALRDRFNDIQLIADDTEGRTSTLRAIVQNELNAEHLLILDAIAEGICGLNTEGTVTFCNRALLQMTGYEREEVVGQNAHDLLHHSRADGSRVPREECELGKAILEGAAAQVVGGLLWRKDGTYLPVEYWGRPVQAPEGRTTYIAMMKDISEIEMAKEALRRS